MYQLISAFEDKQKEKRKRIEMRPLFETSSAMIAPSDVLPYQRHSVVNLSRRGEIKQKLGVALRANYKDPFNSGKLKSKGNI